MKLVVIDNPGANHLKVLDALPPSVKVVVSNQLDMLRESVREADVVLNAIPDGRLLREIFALATRLRIHIRPVWRRFYSRSWSRVPRS